MPAPLESLSDGELSEVFAVEVAKTIRREIPRAGGLRAYSVVQTGAWREIHEEGAFGRPDDFVDYASDANAILPWLQQSPFDIEVCFSNTCANWTVRLLGRFLSNAEFKADADTFARAACIALIRSARATQQDCGVRE